MKKNLSKRCGWVYATLLTMGLFFSPAAGAQLKELNEPGGTNVTIATSESYSQILVGRDEADNHLNIVSGGQVDVATLVEIGQQVDATNSQLNVSGNGLLVIGNASTNSLPSSGIVIGDTAGNGELKVGYDSNVTTDDLYVGAGSNETGRVTAKNGGGIVIEGSLTVGASGNSDNLVTINNGSSLTVNETSSLHIINDPAATDNLNTLNIKNGGSLLIKGDVNTADLESNDGIKLDTGATLGVGGNLKTTNFEVKNGLNILLDNALSTNHTAQFHADFLNIGADDSDNALILKNGATLTSTNALTIGRDDTSHRNSLIMEGSNSTFAAFNSVYVGSNGNDNNLEILDGAEAVLSSSLIIGSSSSSGNEAVVNGTGSVLTVSGDVVVGRNGKNSTLKIEDGSTADFNSNLILGSKSIGNRYYLTGSTSTVAGDFILGETGSASGTTDGRKFSNDNDMTSGNLAFIEDSAAQTNQNLTVGLEGEGSVLVIRDGGSVTVNGSAIIGDKASDNVIYLQSGSNTYLHVSEDLTIGKDEGMNRLAIYGGVADIDGSIYMGASTNQHETRNFIHLETTNATLNVANALYVGMSNSVNEVDLRLGATAAMQDLFVGTYEGTSNNIVRISGNDSLLSISDSLQIGTASGTNNAVYVYNGGTLEIAQEDISIGGTNSHLTFDGGILKTLGWDFSAQTNLATNIVFNSGSTLHMAGVLSGTNMVEGGLSFILDGATADWDAGTNDTLYVGYETDNNSLILTNGAGISATNLYIGYMGGDNLVTVSGTNTQLAITEDLYIGSDMNPVQMATNFGYIYVSDTINNQLNVLEGANLTVNNDAYVLNGATLKIDSQSRATVSGNYTQDEYSVLEIGISSNQTPSDINLVVEGDAKFQPGYRSDHKIISIYDDGIGESNEITIVKAGGLYLGDEQMTAGEIESHIATNSLIDFSITISNSNDEVYFIVLNDFIIRSGSDYLDGQLKDVYLEIEGLAGDPANSNAVAMLDIIKKELAGDADLIVAAMDNHYGEKMSSIPAHNVINMGIQEVAGQLTTRADSTRARMGAATATAQPEGAGGPHQAGQELQGWINSYGTWGSQDAADGFSGYDADISGFMIGADFSVAENILVGIAGGSANGSIDKETGSSTDTKTISAAIYGSIGTKDWFADASFIYGTSDVDTRMGSTFDTTSDYTAQNVAFYVGGGKEIITDYFIITPQASVLANSYSQESYTEEASNAVGREIDSFDAFYFQSALGCSMAMYMGSEDFTFKPEIRAHWLHEWLGDDETVNYNLIGGVETYRLALQAPEKDILKIGIGSAFKFGEYLELRADLDTRRSSSYSDYTLLGSLRYQF